MVTIVIVIVAIVIVGLGFFGLYRPWQLRWGATREEVAGSMPRRGRASPNVQHHPGRHGQSET